MDVRPYQPGDEHHIIALFATAFRRPMTEAYWRWRFIDNPLRQTLVQLCWDGNLLAGHYALTPTILLRHGVEERSGFTGTTMTHPAYRGRGMFTALADALFARVAAEGYTTVWGFPNDQSHRLFIARAAWHDVCVLPQLVLDNPVDAFREVSDGAIAASGVFTAAHAEAIRTAAASYALQVAKTPAYLEWRYRMHPASSYDVFHGPRDGGAQSFVVCKRYAPPGASGAVIDCVEWWIPNDANVMRPFLASVVRHYAQAGPVARIACWMPLHDPRHRTLESVGFQLREPVTYLCARSFTDDRATYDPRSWMLTMGDSDVF